MVLIMQSQNSGVKFYLTLVLQGLNNTAYALPHSSLKVYMYTSVLNDTVQCAVLGVYVY